MTRTVDLLIVGGGPAGAALAAMTAQAGLNTLLVERASFPRDKVCGEFLAAEGCRVLERLGILDELLAAGAAWLDSCRITHPRGTTLDMALPTLGRNGREALGISRERLDASLLSLAGRRGAEIRQRWEAVHPVLVDGRVRGFRVRRVAGDAWEEIRAKLVVAADGRRSVLVRHLHPHLGDPRRTGPRSRFGLKVHLRSDGRAPGRRIDLHLFDGGYAGLCAVEGGRLNLGLIVTVSALRACGGSPNRLLDERLLANPQLRSRIGNATTCGAWKSVGPLRFGARRASAAGAMFVGDAAGTVDPFCGEGMANALCGAELALPYALRAIERGELSADLASEYERAWTRTFGRMTRRARRLGQLLERPRLARPLLALLGGIARPIVPRLVAATRTDWTFGDATSAGLPTSARNRSPPCNRLPPR